MIRRDLLKAAAGLVLGDPERLGWKKGQRVYSFGRERLVFEMLPNFEPPNNFFAQAEAAARLQFHLKLTGQGPIFVARQQAETRVDFFIPVY